MAYRVFRGGAFVTWDQIFTDAAKFATELGPEKVLGISHSEDKGDGVVTVWYWSAEDEAEQG
jgi:hypothetical protein